MLIADHSRPHRMSFSGEGLTYGRLLIRFLAIGRWQQETESGITFKVSDIAYEMLKDQPGLRPATYAA